jgi:hypothetical protein
LTDPFVKSAVDRAQGIVAAEMPLAEMSGPVARVSENFCHGWPSSFQTAPTTYRVPNVHSVGIAARHQGRAGGRACRIDVKIGEPSTLAMQLVEIRCLQNRAAVTGKVTVTLVVSHDENDIGPFRAGDGNG